MSIHIGKAKISVSYYFFAAAALAALCCRDTLFLCGAAAAAIHESGHLAVMLLLPDVSVRKISVGVPGIRITADGNTGRPLILAAGAAANILAAVFSFIWFCAGESAAAVGMLAADICLALCNLLPIEPLDGGLLLRCIIEKKLLPDAADRLMLIVSLSVLCPLTVMTLLAVLRSRGNYSLLILCLWLLTHTIRDYV